MRSLLKLFGRHPAPEAASIPKPVAEPAHDVSLHIASFAETAPATGLIVVEIAARADPPLEGALRVHAEGGTLDKPVSLGPDTQHLWVAVHGHLLPNGLATVHVDLAAADGAVLASRTLSLQVRNEGAVAEVTRAGLKAGGTPLLVDVCDSGLYDYANANLAAWHDGPAEVVEAHLARLEAAGGATDAELADLRHFVEKGFLVLRDVLAPDELDGLNAAIDDAVAKKLEGYEWGASQRLHNLHLLYPAIRELWVHPRVLRMLSLIFDSPARPYQSLTYVFGSEQYHHQDTVVLTPFPAGRMCGVWTALEDIQPESGELIVYPGSHRLPRTYMKDLGIPKVGEDWTAFGEAVAPVWTKFLRGRYAQEVYRPKAGTILIWHENLMHGGMVRRDKTLSRRSIVGHYFADGCVAYHDASGMPGALKDA